MARSWAELFVKTKTGFVYKKLSFVQRPVAIDETRGLIAFFGHQIDDRRGCCLMCDQFPSSRMIGMVGKRGGLIVVDITGWQHVARVQRRSQNTGHY